MRRLACQEDRSLTIITESQPSARPSLNLWLHSNRRRAGFLQNHRDPHEPSHDRHADNCRAEREAAAESYGGDAGECEDEGRIQEREVHNSLSVAELTLGHIQRAWPFPNGRFRREPEKAPTLAAYLRDQLRISGLTALAALGRHLIERGKRGSARAALREAVQIADRLRMRLGDELRAVLAEL